MWWLCGAKRKGADHRGVHVGALHVGVHGALIVTVQTVLLRCDGAHVHNRQSLVQLIGQGVAQNAIFNVPAAEQQGLMRDSNRQCLGGAG